MIRGGWVFRSEPNPDELLSSVLVRNAHLHGCEAYRFVNYFWPGRCVWNRDIDRTDDRKWLAEIAARIGVPSDRLRSTTLAAFGDLLEPGGFRGKGDVRLLLSAGVYHRVRRRHGLQYCPNCLASQVAPHFLRQWRLAFLVNCPVHNLPLLDACPHCDSPIMPHRTSPRRIHCCHACGNSLVTTGVLAPTGEPPASLKRLEGDLLDAVMGSGERMIGPWAASTGFTIVRSMIGIAAAGWRYTEMRKVLGLPVKAYPAGNEVQLEHARHPERLALLETVAELLLDWPMRFRTIAAHCSLTQRSFARASVPRELADEIARLPSGIRRERKYVPILTDPALQRLRRRDPDAYRVARAEALFAACERQSRRAPARQLEPTARRLHGS